MFRAWTERTAAPKDDGRELPRFVRHRAGQGSAGLVQEAGLVGTRTPWGTSPAFWVLVLVSCSAPAVSSSRCPCSFGCRCRVLSWALGGAAGDSSPEDDTNGDTKPFPPSALGRFCFCIPLRNRAVYSSSCGSSSLAMPYANRTIDPSVFGHTTASHNLSLAHAHPGFNQLWARAAADRNNSAPSAGSNPYGPSINASFVASWWARLDPTLGLDFMGGRSCADNNGCVGVLAKPAEGTCVCYK